jgi:hypothetical protein
VFNTTFLTKKETLITIVWLVLRNHAAGMSCMNLGAYVETFSALTDTHLSSSSYKTRLARHRYVLINFSDLDPKIISLNYLSAITVVRRTIAD